MKPTFWRHVKSGDDYMVVDFAVQEGNLIPVVVYRSVYGQGLWTRPCFEFFDGRFEKLEHDPRKKKPKGRVARRDTQIERFEENPLDIEDEL